jgi:hypothetical protein
MTFTIHPVVIEIYDDANDVAAKAEAFDDVASTVTISHITNPQDWPALSAAILRALEQIHPAEAIGSKHDPAI